jgi:hypothetical protein
VCKKRANGGLRTIQTTLGRLVDLKGLRRDPVMRSALFPRILSSFPVLLLSFAGTLRIASGAIVASDSASDPAYAAEVGGAWKGLNPGGDENPPGTDNGGFGFAPWEFAGGYHAKQFSPYDRLNHFIDGVDIAASSFNNLGDPAFGLTNSNLAFQGYTSRATRVFNAALSIGDTLSVDFDNPLPAPLDESDSAGFLFRLNTGGGPRIDSRPDVVERFGLLVTSGFNNNNWTTTDVLGFANTGVNAQATTLGAQFRFTSMAPNSYAISLIRKSDGQVLLRRAGLLSSLGAGSIDTLEILMFGNGSGNGLMGSGGLPTGEREFFFNNLQIDRVANTALLSGDYNNDGIVDAADFVVWRDGLNIIYTQEHLEIWRAHFGQTVPASGDYNQKGPVDAVPEPTSIILIFTSSTFFSMAGRVITRP